MNEGQLALTIPIVTVTLTMAVAIVFILARHRKNALELEHRHKERMAAIDRGLDVPPDPVPVTVQRRPAYLLRGLVWLGVGIALVFGIRPLGEDNANTFGWIPVAVGMAYLIFYFVEGRKNSNSHPAPPASDTNSGSTP